LTITTAWKGCQSGKQNLNNREIRAGAGLHRIGSCGDGRPRLSLRHRRSRLDVLCKLWLPEKVELHLTNNRGRLFLRDHNLLPSLVMDYLWTPWRYAYVTTAGQNEGKPDGSPQGCIFCELPKLADEDTKIVHRGQHCFVILNSFPYTSGHVMVVPFAHLDELQKLPEAAAQEMMALSQKMERVLRQVYTPDGINLGMNIGRAAGAGIAGHVHMHVLPRWAGDTNFMTVTGESRVLPEALEETYERIRGVLGP
jgi:ATP adenylyltransferase